MSETPQAYEVVTDEFGLRWRFRPGTDDHLALGGHEPHFVQICRSLLPEGGTFVDVGAHIGLYTLRLADKAGKVIAVEPNAPTVEALWFNVHLNNHLLDHCEINVRERAAWYADEKVVFLVDPNNVFTGGSTQSHESVNPAVAESDPNVATTVTLDTMLRGEARVDLIKIDVEGAERHVLEGAKETLAKFKPTLFLEMHDFIKPDNRQVIEAILEEADYKHGIDFPYGDGYHWICKHRSAQ